MKKVCLALILVLTIININVFATGEPTITVSNTKVNAGETAEIAVSLADNPGIISMLLNVEYDSDVLTLTGVEDAGILGETYHSDNLSLNPYILSWLNSTIESDIKENGLAATLKFKVSENAKTGIYPIKVFYEKENDGIFNFDMEDVDFKVVNGYVSVQGKSEGAQGGGSIVDVTEPKEISVLIDGEYLEFPDQKPVIKDDRTLVPLRSIFEALKAYVTWDDEEKKVVSVKGDIIISLVIGSDQLYVNGTAITIDVPAQIMNDRTMVPIRAISESFGCDVDWDEATKTVIITN